MTAVSLFLTMATVSTFCRVYTRIRLLAGPQFCDLPARLLTLGVTIWLASVDTSGVVQKWQIPLNGYELQTSGTYPLMWTSDSNLSFLKNIKKMGR